MSCKISSTILVIGAQIVFTVSAKELNYDFIKGGIEIEKFEQLYASAIIPGQYLVTLAVNKQEQGAALLLIEQEDNEKICFSNQWLKENNILISSDFYKDQYQLGRDCIYLSDNEHTEVNFDLSSLKLSLSIPQLGLSNVDEEADWDYGIPAVRFDYRANYNVNELSSAWYSSVGFTGNLGEWVVSSSLSLNDEALEISNLKATKAIKTIKADLSVGRLGMSMPLIGGGTFIGLGLRSNSNMNEFNGYKPVFSGLATSESRVVLRQGGRIIYSEVVAPGPFVIDDVKLVGTGDVTMTTIDSSGNEHYELFPITVVPNLLTEGEFNYGLHSGVRESGASRMSGVFISGDLSYGFKGFTLTSSALNHSRYKAVGVGIIKPLGSLGTFSIDGAKSFFDYQGTNREGWKLTGSYSKSFDSGSRISFNHSYYPSEEFIEFSQFDEDGSDFRSANIRQSSQINISQPLVAGYRLNLSGWNRTYHKTELLGRTDSLSGVSGYVTGNISNVNVNLGINYSKGVNDELAGSFSVSIPLNLFNKRQSVFSTVSYDRNQTIYDYGASTSLSDNVDLSISQSITPGRDSYYSIRPSYKNDYFTMSGQLSKRGSSTTGAVSINGSGIILPTERDVLFTNSSTQTLAVAHVEGVEGVWFDNASRPTNSRGNALVPLSAYRTNKVKINGRGLKDDIEIIDSTQLVFPTDSSVQFMDFNVVKVNRYLLQVKKTNGDFISMGNWAMLPNGQPLGFATTNGIISFNSVEPVDRIVIDDCIVSNFKQIQILQQVYCD